MGCCCVHLRAMDALNLENRAKIAKPAKAKGEPSMPKAVAKPKAKAPAAKGTGDDDDDSGAGAAAKPKAAPKTRVRGKHSE